MSDSRVHFRTVSFKNMRQTLHSSEESQLCKRKVSACFMFHWPSVAVWISESSRRSTISAGIGHAGRPCLKSTCRDVPLRENLTAIDLRTKDLGTKYVRGIVGGFEQGAGIAGGVQFTTADAIPHLELRAAALTSTKLDRRLDLEGVLNFPVPGTTPTCGSAICSGKTISSESGH